MHFLKSWREKTPPSFPLGQTYRPVLFMIYPNLFLTHHPLFFLTPLFPFIYPHSCHALTPSVPESPSPTHPLPAPQTRHASLPFATGAVILHVGHMQDCSIYAYQVARTSGLLTCVQAFEWLDVQNSRSFNISTCCTILCQPFRPYCLQKVE